MPQATSPRRILLVDDSPEDRAAVRRLLAVDGATTYRVEEVTSGDDALRALQEAEFDCVLLDYQLPDYDGVGFLNELIRLDVEETMTAVVLLTGRADDDLIVEVLKRGAQDYLIKGRFTGEVLRRSINDAVIRVETRRELDRLYRESREAIRAKDEALARQALAEARLRHQLDLDRDGRADHDRRVVHARSLGPIHLRQPGRRGDPRRPAGGPPRPSRWSIS